MRDVDTGPGPAVKVGSCKVDRLWTSGLAQNVAVVSCVALVLGVTRLGRPSIWLDEAFTARAINYPYPDLLLQFHWVFYSLEKAWTSLAGTSEWALRAPAVLGAMAASALLVVLASRLFDSWIGLLSGLLLATNPFFVKWSQQARGYTLLVAVSLLAALLLIRALDRGTRGAWLAYGLALSAVLMVHPIAGLVLLPAHAVFIFQRRERLVPDALLAACVVVVLGMSWVGIVAIYTTGEGSTSPLTFPTGEAVARALMKNSGVAGLGLLFALIGLWLLRRAGSSDVAAWLGIWAFAPFLITISVSTVKLVFLDRYLIVTAPAFALLAALAVRQLAPRLRVPVVVVALAATTFGLLQWYLEGRGGNNWHGENWRGALQEVYEERQHPGPVLVIPFFAYPGASYYGAEWDYVAPDSDSVWALWWSEKGHALSEEDRRALGLQHHRLIESLQFGWRLRAQHWVRPRPGQGS